MINYEDYAKALYELSSEENISDTVFEELMLVRDVLASNSEFVKLLDSPASSKEERVAMIDDTFKDASYVTVNFLKLLTEMRQMSSFAKCVESFSKLYDSANGILRAEIVTAVDISDAQCASICEKVASATGKKVIPVNKTDPSILGGVMLRYDGIQLDGSVASRLSDIKQQLAELVL